MIDAPLMTPANLAFGHTTPPPFQGILVGLFLSAAIWATVALSIL